MRKNIEHLYLLTRASDLQVAQHIENQLGLDHRNGLLVDFPTTKGALSQAFYTPLAK